MLTAPISLLVLSRWAKHTHRPHAAVYHPGASPLSQADTPSLSSPANSAGSPTSGSDGNLSPLTSPTDPASAPHHAHGHPLAHHPHHPHHHHRFRPLRRDVILGVRRAIVSSYRPETYYWEAALLTQRLVLSLLFSFGSAAPGVRSLVVEVLCVIAVVLHVAMQPLRSRVSQLLQTWLLFCLCIVALCGMPFAIALDSAAESTSGAAFSLAYGATTVFGIILPLIGFAISVTFPRTWWCASCDCDCDCDCDA